ncbi:hypothetical protein L210DRAFT_962448 [Boletus edulis BED1]|uniref:DUF6589 domain-containing protein n=1 Tax=Boletus edulis BED1 TaxID=1328754 RepID=A0AAD4G5X5_BOLED|nr:hypothetical protein L210DRAFT_962448 [Boletus edulis BED1]
MQQNPIIMGSQAIQVVVNTLEIHNLTLTDFLLDLLASKTYYGHHIFNDLGLRGAHLDEEVHSTLTQEYVAEVTHVATEESGWHFGVHHSTLKQFEEFSLEDMAHNLEVQAPKLWGLLGKLLGGCKDMEDEHTMETVDGLDNVDADMVADDNTYWDEVEEIDLEGFINGLTADEGSPLTAIDKQKKQHAAMLLIQRIVIFGIMMNSTNQKANALSSVLGFFFQSMHIPQKVIETLSRIGISISNESITAATRSLSIESKNNLQSLGQCLLTSYAYDNFDVDLKVQVSVLEKSTTSLKHLMSGLLFPLAHGVTINDLKCSSELWKKSAINPHAEKNDLPPRRTWQDLLKLHQEPLLSTSSSTPNLSCCDRFNSWVFLTDLCTHGPVYFPMDINNSTVSGNIQAIVKLLVQGGVCDPTNSLFQVSGSPDLSEYVVLVHGDLGTGERLLTATWDCFQHVIFVPGLFHLKMACADPLTAREDETSLMRDVSHLRPKETGTYISKPGFRRMHQLIGHAGVVRWLDCWRTYWTSVEAMAMSKPGLDDLQTLADEIALNYVTSHQLYGMRWKTPDERDMQSENALLLNKYFLLYEELSYAMNIGDVGWLETCIVSWIPILKASGKHKYATHMTNFLLNVHFVYPTRLRHVVQYHILVNPTGKDKKWRGVDWCVELNNLYTKVRNGRKGPNRTVERILLELPLVQAYRNIQATIQKNFLHTHLTTNHLDPNMTKTFTNLANVLSANSPHVVTLGRKIRHETPDLIDKGWTMMEKAKESNESNSGMEPKDEPGGARPEIEDILSELLG